MLDWPLRGRDEFVARLRESLGGGRGAVLFGAAGVGKTRLAREVVAGLDGVRTVWTAATPGLAAVPFGAFVPYVDELPDTADRTALLFRLVRSLGGDPPAVIVVDDAHHLDEGSAAVVHQLAVSRRALPLLTVRGGEPVADDVVRLWRNGYAERIELPPFDRDGARALLEGALGGQVDALTVELVWRWTGDLAVSGELSELLRSRLGRLPDPTLTAVAALAIAEPARPRLLSEMATPEAVRALADGELCVSDTEAGARVMRLAHPLYAAPALELAGEAVVGNLRRAYAKALCDADPGRNPVATLRAIVARVDAGELVDDHELLAAAEQAGTRRTEGSPSGWPVERGTRCRCARLRC